MTVKETNMILMILQAAFPAFYKALSPDELRDVRNLWQLMFSEESYEVVASAVKVLIATKEESYPPTIGAVKEKIQKITHQNQMSEMEAWSMVSRACRNSSYNSQAEFDKLPEVIQRAIGSAEQLRIWAQMDAETVNSVVASNFMRSFKAKQREQKEIDMMPEGVRGFINSVGDSMRLETGSESKKEKMIPAGAKLLEEPKEEKILSIEEGLKIARPVYEPPPEDEWVKMREAALSKLAANQ